MRLVRQRGLGSANRTEPGALGNRISATLAIHRHGEPLGLILCHSGLDADSIPRQAAVCPLLDTDFAAPRFHAMTGFRIAPLPGTGFCLTLKAMDVQLTSDQKAFARRAIESGRLATEADAVQEALALWEERERQRAEFLLTLDEAKASMARGEGRVITHESMRELAGEVRERGRARLLAELTSER